MDALTPLLAISFVLALLAGAVWVVRKRGLPRVQLKGAGRKLVPVERTPLSPQHALWLVRFRGRALLIAIHPTGCELLESVPWRDLEVE